MFLSSFNKIFESKVRLGIMSALMVTGSVSYLSLKEILNLTDGNLASHLRTLEEAGYISVFKKFIGKKPHTSYLVTDSGREAFLEHLQALEQFIRDNV